MPTESVIEADLTWVDETFEQNVQILVGHQGLIEQVGYLDRKPNVRLTGCALLPGMVNTHSQAFLRGLRGFAETFAGHGNSLRQWRQAVGELIECLGPKEFKNLCHVAFREMLLHGITTVGEFHYFHHERDEEDFAYDELVLEAAADAGIRLVLLCCYFARGGLGQPLSPIQRRFKGGTVEDFCARVDRLRTGLNDPQLSIGLAAYNLSSVSPEEFKALHEFATLHDLPLHMNAESQQAEVDDCRAVYGASPVELLLERNLLDRRVTLMHCTNTPADTMRKVAESGARLCACPSTEANLALGWAEVPAFMEAGGAVCLGTDTNVRISMNEEMRWLEYAQRARGRVRGVCVDAQGRTANALWRCATANGANALGIKAGRIASGCTADFFAVDMTGVSLLGATRDSLLPAFITGADRAAITHTCVAGQWQQWPS